MVHVVNQQRRVYMSIRIITESSSDIEQSMAKELDITVLPIHLHIGNEDYIDGFTLL